MKTITFLRSMALAGLMLLTSIGWGQTTINFDDAAKWTAGSAALGSYASDHTYIDGVFSATGGPALRNGTATQDGFPGALGTYSWRLRDVNTVDWRITISSGGVSTFSVKVRRWDGTPSPDFNLEYSTDGGTDWTLVAVINNSSLDNSSDWKTFNGTINSENINIIIRFKANGTTERIMVDDFTWTGFGDIPLPPSISNIIQTPDTDITSTTTVSVSADITEGDAAIETVELRWGTVLGNYPNTITMTAAASKSTNYATVDDIPAQTDGTTVYYVIYAEDADEESATSTVQSYEVRDARFTTLPYEETFDTDLGDCYVYNVSGETKKWIWQSGYAYMSGFNTGDIEEDWLILPGINLNNYEDEVLTFETWWQFGSDDENNYLKLLYSNDYSGIGDPSLANWFELAFTKPASDQTWTSSGNVDLSGISGTSIWVAFKYRYEPGKYRNWRVDDINIFEASMPLLTVNPETLSGFTYDEGNGPSASKFFEVTGLNLDGTDVTITAPADFEVADSENGTYGSSITLTAYDGSPSSIWVRLASGLAIDEYSGAIAISGGGATAKNVAVSGSVTYNCGPLSFPFYEEFDYPVSSKLVDYCWGAHSGAGTNSISVTAGSITYPGYLSSGIGNQVTLTTTGEDVNRQFLVQTSGTVFFSFLVNVTSATTAGDYFFHVGQSVIGTTYRGRVFVKKDANDKLAFGVAQSTTPVNYSDFVYDLNTTYLIVLRYEIIEGASNDVSSIYINPPLNMSIPLTGWISNTDASGTDLTELGTVALRQGTATNAPQLILDGIRVSNNWADIVGEASVPVLVPDPNTLSGFEYTEGTGPSSIQSFTLTGENLTGNVTLTKPASYEISTEGGELFESETTITLIPDEGAVASAIYVRLEADLSAGSYNENILVDWEGDNFYIGLNGAVNEAVTEPSNHVTNFTAEAGSPSSITVSWTDSDADGYLIKGSVAGFEAIVAPVDGVPEADDGLVKNIAAGPQNHVFTNLEAFTEYFFMIFPYNGSGALINYKTDGEVPQANATTEVGPAEPEIFTQWDFEADPLTPNVTNPDPAIGSGLASAIGSMGTLSRGTGSATGCSQTTGTGSWAFGSVSPGTNESSGAQFMVSTVGFEDIAFRYDQRFSNAATRTVRVQYTLDGTTWNNLDVTSGNYFNDCSNRGGIDLGRIDVADPVGANAGDSWSRRNIDFSGIIGANNNANFGVRIVAAHYAETGEFRQANNASLVATGGTWRFDNVTFSGLPIIPEPAAKLAVIDVNGGLPPLVDVPFTVTVQSQDESGVPANVTEDTEITLSLAAGSGIISGTLTATLNSGQHTVVLNGVLYNLAEQNVSITASATEGMELEPGTSSLFEVLAPATHLAFVDFPAEGVINTKLSPFTVEARRADNTVDPYFVSTVTLNIAGKSGQLSGTTSVAAVAGVATFNNLWFDTEGDYTLNAEAEGLTEAISNMISIAGGPEDVIAYWSFDLETLNPTFGEGVASNIGGTSSAWAAGSPGRGWNTSAYPEQGTNSGTAGVQFMVSTMGYQDILLSFKHRASGTSSRWAEVQYTLDGGGTWQILANNAGGLSPHDTFHSFDFNFLGIPGANNNADFGVRIVSIFSPLEFNQNETLSYGPNEAYMRANTQATYPPDPGSGTGDYSSTNGTWRFDDITFTGNPYVAIPASLNLFGIIIVAEEDNCYAATESITVSNFVVQDGGAATFVTGPAGFILLQEGVEVQNGGYLRAWIDMDENYCEQPLPEVAVKSIEAVVEALPAKPELMFKVYPNPNTGMFSLELLEPGASASIMVEIYNLMGERLLQNEMLSTGTYRVDISTLPAGVYIIRIIADGKAEMQKIIKQ